MGRGQLRLVAAVDEVAHDVEVLHVLASGKFGSGGRHQAALSIDHVRSQAAAGSCFLQAADQELEIDHGSDHAQEPLSIIHRITDEENGARGLSFANDEGLSVIGAAIAGSGVGSFQFAVQKGVGRDASGRNSFTVGVQQSRVSDFVGRGYEVFQQGPQFGGLDIGLANVAAAGYLNRGRQVGQHHVAESVRAAKDRRPENASPCSAAASRWSSDGPR